MDRNPESPWNPLAPIAISPTEFEQLVLDWLRLSGDRQQQSITTEHLGIVRGEGGSYKIDVLVTFEALGGAMFMVLVECKHQRRPVEREDVMILEAKLRDANAQKAMLFSTSGFQSGAITFASAKHIATVTVGKGEWLWHARYLAPSAERPKPPLWVHFDRYAGWMMRQKPSGTITISTIDTSHIDPISEWLSESRAE